MKQERPKISRLQVKTIFSAGILTLLSILISFVLYYGVCYRLIAERAEQLDNMFLQTAVERTNRYLGEIAKIVNIAYGDKNLELLLSSAGEGSENSYSRIFARSEYEKHLRNIILNYDQVENFAFLAGGTLSIVYESGNLAYRSQIQDFLTQNASRMSSQTRQFYLLNLSGNRKSSIAIFSPLFQEGQSEPSGCIVAVLGKEFSRQLQFASDQIYLMDQFGTLSSLKGEKNELPSGEGLLERDLVFPGWRLASASFRDPILKNFTQRLWIFTVAGAFYLVLSLAVAWRFSGRLVHPLRQMNRSLHALSGQQDARWRQDAYQVGTKRKRLHFKHQLMIFYILLVSVPVLFSTVGFYFATQQTLDQRIGYFFEHRANFLFDQLDLTLRRYRRTAVELAYDADVQGYMNAAADQKAEQESAVSRLLLQKQTQEQGILNIALLQPSGKLQYSSFYSRSFIDSERYSQLIGLLREDPYRLCWSMAYPNTFNRDCITLALSMFSMPPGENVGKCVGYLVLDFDATELESLLDSFEKQGLSRIFLLDKNRNPVFPDSLVQWETLPAEITAPFSDNRQTAGGVTLIEEPLSDFGLSVLTVIPRQEYLQERSSILVTCIAIIVLLLLLCLFFSYFSSVALSRSLESLIRFVKRIDSTRFQDRFHSARGDEIEELGESFNEMLDRLDQLIEQQLEAERQLQNSRLIAKQFELNLLQSQINPHFLYNTLKTIQYMVHVQDSRAEKMIRLLIHLFRTGISKNERLVTVAEELRHVTTYLEIQQIRFADKFKVEISAGDEVRSLYLLKLTLQPIVENAIYHGLELLDRPGHLNIRVTAAETLTVEISDDGNGMSPEKLQSIREKLSTGKSDSIGLLNVHERIRLYFGSPYGITVESRLHKGTCVTILFPRIEDPGDFPSNCPPLSGANPAI